jgi:hypothetical protein
LWQPVAHQDAAIAIDDGAERMGQHHGGIGGQATPMAGMDSAGSQVDYQVEMEGAARAGGDGRHVGHHARTVAADQHIGGEFVLVGSDEFPQAH